MTIKLTANLKNPPISGLATAHLIKESHPVEIVWGKETTLEFPDGKKLQCYSNNDILRALARFAPQYNLYGETAIERTQIDHWLSFSLTCGDDISWAMEFLEKSIAPVTYLVANKLTIADFALFNEMHSRYEALSKKGITRNVQRWYNLIIAQPLVQKVLSDLPREAIDTLKKSNEKQNSPESTAERKQEGKFVDLPGAEMGKVVVRFPPEASGYLHIGHAKAALLNQYYQQAFQGKLIMRFDDTNPAKENVEFEEVILKDLELLKIKPDVFSYSSDYFDLMLEYCEKLLRAEKAYVDDTDPLTMKTEREQRVESHNRLNSVEKNLEMWKEMLAGSAKGVTCCVRAKIDMKSDNGCMRDPTIYRCKPEPHPRSGTKYKVYPTYDFACPIVDAIENVTHTLRTMEYHDRDDQFYWFIEALGLRRPYIWEYSRLNMTNTVLSKRKLTWFVEQGLVDGWDDPRFPTVRGVLRRGMTVEGLKEFIIAQGSSKSVVFMEWDKIWAFNKKVIDPIAPRYTALESKEKTVVVTVTGQTKVENIEVSAHPKNADVGKKIVTIAPKILIDYVDAEALKEGENATFINWGNLLINKINKSSGKIISVDAQLNLENKDFKKTLKLTWLADLPDSEYPPTYCVYFDHIISKAVLGKEEDFKSYIGHKTRQEVKMLGDPELKKCKTNDIIQLQRRGYFRVERAYEAPNELSFVPGAVILYSIPDGHTKEMPTSGNKLSSQGTAAVTKKSSNADELSKKIVDQGNLVRDLKSRKAAKDQIDIAVKNLLSLKADYKIATGIDWKPVTEATKNLAPAFSGQTSDICQQISAQGEKVRDLKAKKAEKGTIDAEVKTLLALKAEYKSLTGAEWKPGAKPPNAVLPAAATGDADDLCQKISAQGEKVRDLKAKKAEKGTIDIEVKSLLALKAEYKSLTGAEWKPGAKPPSAVLPPAATGDADGLCQKISAQGEKVRDLKTKKADKGTIDAEVKRLLALKAEYKAVTGSDWKPGSQQTKVESSVLGNAAELSKKIETQGNKIRNLKDKKSEKATIDAEVKTLLTLKAEYKTMTGVDWKPATAPSETKKDNSQEGLILQKIKDQGNKIRRLKADKAPKTEVDLEVKTLLDLKAEYKIVSGEEWTPNAAAPSAKTSPIPKDDLTKQVNEQAEKVRQLKAANASKNDIDAALKVLLELKTKYKEVSGTDFPTTGRGGSKKSQPKEKPIPVKKESDTGVKKQTRLGLEASKEENLPDWYSQVLTKGEMIEYYDISGCYILRHWSFAIWKAIKNWFDAEITKLGVKECYFPTFVSKSALEKEKDHIEDFSPEVAWVTKSGDTDLAEPIAIRPTSETVMYPSYAKWIQSYRDLPLKLNQWNNVVRWEFKHPQPFLRTREFLWQEGHTAFATKEEADEEVLTILDLYSKVYTDLLAIPVIKGKKTTKEKFAGGDYTTTVEAFISASGRAIQGATSHHLGQNFSKMCEIVFEDPETQTKKYVYQNSWGITTRTIGVMIMVHADNQGLVLPPRVAAIQAIVVPCGVTVNMKEDEKKQLLDNCKSLEQLLMKSGIRCEGDYRDNYSPGWKFNHWELKGVPIRIEIGPKDMKANQMVAVRRDTGEKLILSCDDVDKKISQLLETIHESMFAKAKLDMTSHTKITKNWNDFCSFLDQSNVMMSPFCGDKDCETKIKADSARDQDADPNAPSMGAKSLCIPFDQPAQIAPNDKCVHPSCSRKPKFYCLFGRSY